jgi:hypothetical protein
VTLQRGPGKQPAHQLTILDLEAQRHIRGHPQLPRDQVGRTCLPHVAGDAVQGIPAPGRRRGDKGLPHHVQHDLVGHQLGVVQILLDGSRPAE